MASASCHLQVSRRHYIIIVWAVISTGAGHRPKFWSYVAKFSKYNWSSTSTVMGLSLAGSREEISEVVGERMEPEIGDAEDAFCRPQKHTCQA